MMHAGAMPRPSLSLIVQAILNEVGLAWCVLHFENHPGVNTDAKFLVRPSQSSVFLRWSWRSVGLDGILDKDGISKSDAVGQTSASDPARRP